MLHFQTIEPNTLALLENLMQKPYLNQFVLVGGTALALQLGTRKSIDLDLFTSSDFSSANLLPLLLSDYPLQINLTTEQTIICNIHQIKVDFIRFRYPFSHEIKETNGIRYLGIEDIGAMKLDAITGRGSKKDFFDLCFLLEHYSLEQLLVFYQKMYAHQTIFHVVRSLSYFIDADAEPDPIVFNKKYTWSKVKKQITIAIKSL